MGFDVIAYSSTEVVCGSYENGSYMVTGTSVLDLCMETPGCSSYLPDANKATR